jgi:hypothetical protein
VSDTTPELFVKAHGNLGKIVAKFFETVLFLGTVTEIIPRRKDFYYKITYEDGDQEDMNEAELQYGLEMKHNKQDRGEKLTIEAVVGDDLSGLSKEGSVYDIEENKQLLTSNRL